ncbi:hypothetical protein P170DRAFT_451884 [Aspergillus steynii IBT 23096]|uniref:Zn(2)-C6 fungal-type domain-containing protein n=1 Tax=Aspergillus steynii IBT 23096 TaxID=1392250 RepID=A0A2I2GM65_9EURO|nr:uncharacterized protein P170DRAFT_451884 [Aspergillus steynii IBT 23096]PLB53981.1 hypothetical protein P170DRAFT_451884 [Aspergillus steynii IBT 23096]
MSENNIAPAPAPTPLSSARACDLCRRRKIRCERVFPCSNCQRMNVECKSSRRTTRQKQKRTLISAEYEAKIDHIDKSLAQLSRLVEQLHTSGLSLPQSSEPARSAQASVSSTVFPGWSRRAAVPLIDGNIRSSNDRTVTRPKTENEALVEGRSSLTAHSEFAIGVLQNMVGCHRGIADNSEITGLLDSLRDMVDAFNRQRLSPKILFPLANSVSPEDGDTYPMPPLESVFAMIYNAQAEDSLFYGCLSYFLGPRTLSDLCLKVYFSKVYSDAEFIILNASMLFVSGDIHGPCNDDEQFQMKCRVNLETMLSGLSLYIKASYDMILALVLGAMYAIDISSPSLAWTLVGAASQASHYLGLHTRDGCMEVSSPTPSQRVLLFWAVYFLEKSLCLRLGRSSTISDCDITAPRPAHLPETHSHSLVYFNQQVRFASLAGSVYEQLYSGDALQLPAEARTNRARELAEQLDRHATEACEAYQHWDRSTTDSHSKEHLRFISASDDITRLTMLTLVHRAMPVGRDSVTTFNRDCVSSARAALERHRAFITELGIAGSPHVSTYINWTILFTPFIPFLVLFCHVIETGDLDDLNRMQIFVTSMEGSCQESGAIAKHHRLFQVFYRVAERYTELMCSPTLMQEDRRNLKSQVDLHLSALGLQPNGSYMVGQPTAEAGPMASSATVDMGPSDQDWPQQGFLLGSWFSFNQQMMDLMDQNDFAL